MEWNLWRRFIQLGDTECVDTGHGLVVEIEEQNAQQHQNRAKQCVEEKLDRRVKLPRTTPDANQQVHGHQHGFPENKKEEEIQRHEDA